MDQYLKILSLKSFFFVALLVALILTGLLFCIGRIELVPQLWVSIVVAILSYWACTFTSEKLRLDLFDRRFEIYSNTLDYCSAVLAYASLEARDDNREQIENAISAAHESFRGIGFHKTRALFGKDIVELFEKLNKSYAYISAFGPLQPGGDGFDHEEYWIHVTRTVDIANKLPDHFEPYMYFGDLRRS